MEEKEDGIFWFWILIKIIRQDDEEPFLLTQHIGEECLVSDRILKLLRRFRRKKRGDFLVFWATGMVSTWGFSEECEEEKVANPNQTNLIPSFKFHQRQYIPKEASLQPLNFIRFRDLPCIPRGNFQINFFWKQGFEFTDSVNFDSNFFIDCRKRQIGKSSSSAYPDFIVCPIG